MVAFGHIFGGDTLQVLLLHSSCTSILVFSWGFTKPCPDHLCFPQPCGLVSDYNPGWSHTRHSVSPFSLAFVDPCQPPSLLITVCNCIAPFSHLPSVHLPAYFTPTRYAPGRPFRAVWSGFVSSLTPPPPPPPLPLPLRAVHLGPSGVLTRVPLVCPSPLSSLPDAPGRPLHPSGVDILHPNLHTSLRNCIAPGRPFRAVWSIETIPTSNLPPRTLLALQQLRAVHLGPSVVKTLAHFPCSYPNTPLDFSRSGPSI